MDDRSDDKRRPQVSRIEIFAGPGRQRWDDAVKARIVAESLAPGAIVTHVARRHGCRPQQVHDWRKLARQGRLVLPSGAPQSVASSTPMLVPLLAEAPLEPSSKRPKACAEIVIEMDGAVVHVRGRPEGEVLNDIFSALRRSRVC
jgi:transposase